ncbi:MAG: GrpB family protein, partial [Capnocytophaga leadbetteri]
AYTAHKTDFVKQYTLIAKEEFKGKYENNRPYKEC